MNEDQIILFQEQLEHQTGIKLRLRINDNRSTMLSVKWEPDYTKISLHRMFLYAPKNVMEALACYLKGEHKQFAPSIKAYVEDSLKQLDYSHTLDLSKLQTQGIVYDLASLYHQINRDYFNQALSLHITWFGKGRWRRGSTRIIFGLYEDSLRLIKINRMLDDVTFPEYFVAYVIYHEMLHFTCPSYVDERGQRHIHSKAFKEKEKEFAYYPQARRWIREHKHYLFSC